LTDFSTLGLSPVILKSVTELGFTQPTPIQVQAIPHLLEGRDLVGLAQTGTGKTAAFGLPLIQKLSGYGARPGPRATHALILAPTRELVNQIATNLRGFVRHSHLKVTAVVGGQSINVQSNALQRGTDILVATPGRLLDLVERRAVRLDTAKVLILDEADQMLDLGFIHALRQIAKLVGTPRQTMLFSATMPNQIEELSRAYLVDPVRVEVTPPGRTADRIAQSVHFVEQRAKTGLLTDLLKQRPGDLSLVFARTKHGAEKLMKNLVKAGLAAASIHGNKSQGQRERAIKAFRDGEVRVLVATDVAARGIDIPGVSHVYNFDLPEVAESYVHRIGRTARAGAEGKAVAFCSAAEMHLLKGIEKLTGVPLEIAGGTAPSRQAAAQAADEASKERRDAQRQRPGNGPRMKSGQQRPGQKTAAAKSGQRQGDQQRPAGNKRRRPRRQRAAA
jgi:ATP-dependent RNA helicase RhlE